MLLAAVLGKQLMAAALALLTGLNEAVVNTKAMCLAGGPRSQ